MAATDLADIHLPADAVVQLRATDTIRWIHSHGSPVNSDWWTVELTKHGLDDTILGDSITRGDIFNIAQPALDDPAAALTLLWNSLAWGSGDRQRNKQGADRLDRGRSLLRRSTSPRGRPAQPY
ncbi:hypothetical protein C6A86_001405 [Mycobacterium sp. ITM-2016-00316]|uniref:8-oxoguanine DNA glycosylase OGG fold protein n=1 Tax=Mycobacterium sp. ITM-2016-00316 TaxID=2099695 RepID=UPI001E3E0C72|nr:hypothetical protein [Mycobacterium sp. ITM-2016-00316]WNG82393.1 hypothetical protein C6A86_001405 [Mycobacterium sp. ITM-2016-00316]